MMTVLCPVCGLRVSAVRAELTGAGVITNHPARPALRPYTHRLAGVTCQGSFRVVGADAVIEVGA